MSRVNEVSGTGGIYGAYNDLLRKNYQEQNPKNRKKIQVKNKDQPGQKVEVRKPEGEARKPEREGGNLLDLVV
jgi:hypothetical protein